MLTDMELQSILSYFGLTFRTVTKLYDKSHGEDSRRKNV